MLRPSLATLLLLSLAGPAAAQSFAYAPGTQRYRVEQTVDISQTVQGTEMAARSGTTQFVTLALAPQGTTLQATFTLDSMTVAAGGDASSPMQAQARAQAEDAARSLKGQRVKAVLSPTGRLETIQAESDSLPNRDQFANGFRSFLVPFPPGAVRAGMTWTDTVTSAFRNMSGLDGTSRAITTYTVTGDTTVHGMPAWRIEQRGALTMSGAGTAQGTDVSMEGTGTSQGVLVLGKSGVYLGGTMQQEQSLEVQVPAAGMTIPVRNRATVKVEHVGG